MSKTLPLILVLILAGCGPRWETAREQVLAQIDSLLDGIDLKSREATASVAELGRGVDQLSHARIDVQVRHTRLSEDLTSVQEKLARTQEGHSRQALQSEAESLKTTKGRLGRVLALLESRERQARNRLQNLRILLSQIDSKRSRIEGDSACRGGVRKRNPRLSQIGRERKSRNWRSAIDTELQFQRTSPRRLEFRLGVIRMGRRGDPRRLISV